jgi:FMN-dependent NADH-azoreductase
MEIKAKLIVKGETESFGANNFRKRKFVVEYAENPQYPEFIEFELIQDKCDSLDQYEIGAMMTIAYNLKGRKYEHPEKGDQYYNSLQAWRLSGGEQSPNATGTPQAEGTQIDDNDSLPF